MLHFIFFPSFYIHLLLPLGLALTRWHYMEDAGQLLCSDRVGGPAEEGAVVQGRHWGVSDDAVTAQGGEASLERDQKGLGKDRRL